MKKYKMGDKIYWYEAIKLNNGYYRIQKVTQDNNGTRVAPVIDWLTEEEANDAIASGHPFRYLGEQSRRRGPE